MPTDFFHNAIISRYAERAADSQALYDAHVARWAGDTVTTWDASVHGWHGLANEDGTVPDLFYKDDAQIWDVADAASVDAARIGKLLTERAKWFTDMVTKAVPSDGHCQDPDPLFGLDF